MRLLGLTLVLASLTLAGCHTFSGKHPLIRNHSDDYLQSANYPPLKAPASIHLYAQDPYYAIPYQANAGDKRISMLPPGSYAAQKHQAESLRKKHGKS